MTYRIEIKAETLAELAGKAYAFAVGVQSTIASVNHVSREEVASFTVPVNHMTVTHSEPEVAEEAPAPLPSSGQTEASPSTEEKASASSPTEASDAPSELNFDTDVAPIVLQVVKDKGKPVVQEILEQFGVERASTLDPSRWPELVAQLKDAL